MAERMAVSLIGYLAASRLPGAATDPRAPAGALLAALGAEEVEDVALVTDAEFEAALLLEYGPTESGETVPLTPAYKARARAFRNACRAACADSVPGPGAVVSLGSLSGVGFGVEPPQAL